jgi:hypothetical protein
MQRLQPQDIYRKGQDITPPTPSSDGGSPKSSSSNETADKKFDPKMEAVISYVKVIKSHPHHHPDLNSTFFAVTTAQRAQSSREQQPPAEESGAGEKTVADPNSELHHAQGDGKGQGGSHFDSPTQTSTHKTEAYL